MSQMDHTKIHFPIEISFPHNNIKIEYIRITHKWPLTEKLNTVSIFRPCKLFIDQQKNVICIYKGIHCIKYYLTEIHAFEVRYMKR